MNQKKFQYASDLEFNIELLKSYKKFDEHFEGYSHLKAITYCNSPETLLKLYEKLGYESIEVFVGDKLSKDYREKLIGKPSIADKLESLKERDKLRIYTLKEDGRSEVHTKLYILEKDQDHAKIIIGSPNLTKTGWSGNQKNTITDFKVSKDHDVYRDTINIYREQLENYGELFLEDLTETIQLNQDIKEREKVIEEWLEGKSTTADAQKILFDKMTKLATTESKDEKIKLSTLGYDDKDIDFLREETKDFGGSMSGSSFEIPIHGVSKLYREKYKIPTMRIEENDLRFLITDKSESMLQRLPMTNKQIDLELKNFEKYFELVEQHGKTNDIKGVQSHMFDALLYFFWSPFCHHQAKYYKENDLDNITKKIPFLYIYGESNAGKGTLTKYGLRLISKNHVVGYMEGDELGKRTIRRIRCISTCFPVVIDDIEKKDMPKTLLTNYWDQWDFESPLSTIIFTSNDGKPKPWFKSRAKILHFDVMFEENKEVEKQLNRVINRENKLFEWFSYLFLNTDPNELFLDDEGKLEQEDLAPARKVFKKIYDSAGRDIPDYFLETPAEKFHDKGKEIWKNAYEDGTITKIENLGDRLLVHFDLQNYEIFRYLNEFPGNIRAIKKGSKIEVYNPEDFFRWMDLNINDKNRVLKKIKGMFLK